MSDQATRLRRMVEELTVCPVTTGKLPSPSLARGSVSYGPLTSRRRMAPSITPKRGALAKAVAIVSGKGGVGKTNVAVNMAVCLAQMKQRVCLLDADLGLANADVLCNLTPKVTLADVVAGRFRLAEAMLPAPGGFRLIPGASGISRMADLRSDQRLDLLEQLSILEEVADILVIDTGAGISSNVLAFAAAAHSVIVVTSPEPTSITDAYGTVKALVNRRPEVNIQLLVNMVESEEQGRAVFARIDRVSRTFLRRRLSFAGCMPFDSVVSESVHERLPFSLFAPESAVTREIRAIARRVAGVRETEGAADRGFFSRVLSWLGGNSNRN